MTIDIEEPETAPEEGGLHRAGRRSLTPAERRVVRRRSLWLRAKFAAAVLLFWIVLFAALMAGVIVEEASGGQRLLVAGLMLLLFGGTVVLFLTARSWLGDSRTLGRDARRGYVQRFAAAIRPEEESDPKLRPLFAAGLLKRDPATRQWFEVLPHSGFLWQVNGARPRGWILFLPPEPVEVAETPAFAAVAAEWAEPLSGDGAPASFGRRELSEDERRELRQQTRRLLRAPLAWIIPCNLWFWTVVWFGLHASHSPHARGPHEGPLPGGFGWAFWYALVQLLVLATATVVGDILLVQLARDTGRRLRDARIGRVIIVRCPVVDEEEPDAAPADHVTLELLPVSEAVWTIDGEPAAWRTAG